MAENTTIRTKASVRKYIAAIEPGKRRAEAEILLRLMQRATGFKPAMWGTSIIGFGEYHYKYASGREGDFLLTGFAPRKSAMSIYIIPGFKRYKALLDRLGKHRTSVSCLYVTRLDSTDLDVLAELVAQSLNDMKTLYPQWKP